MIGHQQKGLRPLLSLHIRSLVCYNESAINDSKADLMTMKKKILLISVPRLSPEPQSSIRNLKTSLTHNGIDAEIFDANLDLYHEFSHHQRWVDLEKWAINNGSFKETDQELWSLISSALDKWCDIVDSHQVTHVGISTFTTESRAWTKWLCHSIRSRLPDTKILIGGKGLNDPGIARAVFGEHCLEWELCDHYFNGESEKTLIDYLLDRPTIVDNFDTFVVNDDIDTTFENYDNSLYKFVSDWYDPPILEKIRDQYQLGLKKTSAPKFFEYDYNVVHTSYATRGCVKRCTFCDVPLLRPKFSMREPKNIFEEIQCAIEQKNCKIISFKDDMINGSNRQFMTWLEMLANYFDKNNITDVRWSGQFGIKARASQPKELFDLLSRTGASLQIGIDHFSTDVLRHMKKHYDESDILWFFEQAADTNILYKMLMFIVGYPTETEKDFQQLVAGVRKLHQYQDQVMSWDFGNLCNAPIGSDIYNLPGMSNNIDQGLWNYSENPELSYEVRLDRLHRLDDLSNELNIRQTRPQLTLIRIDK